MLGNQWHALAMSEGFAASRKLFTKKGVRELQSLGLGRGRAGGAKNFSKLLDQLEPRIAELDRAVQVEANRREDACLLDDPSRNRPVTLAFVLAIRFSSLAFSAAKRSRVIWD